MIFFSIIYRDLHSKSKFYKQASIIKKIEINNI